MLPCMLNPYWKREPIWSSGPDPVIFPGEEDRESSGNSLAPSTSWAIVGEGLFEMEDVLLPELLFSI